MRDVNLLRPVPVRCLRAGQQRNAPRMALGSSPTTFKTSPHQRAAALAGDDHEIGLRRHRDVETLITIGPQLNALPPLPDAATQQLARYPTREFLWSNEQCHEISSQRHGPTAPI